MRYRVGIDHPAGSGGEVEAVLRTVGLEAGILFEEVVEAHHEIVVGAALDGWDGCAESNASTEGFSRATEKAVYPWGDLNGGKLLDDGGEGIAYNPVAGARWVNIVEEAQNAGAMGWASREGVGVKQVIAASVRQIAPFFLLWPETGVIELPVGFVGCKKTSQEFCDAL